MPKNTRKKSPERKYPRNTPYIDKIFSSAENPVEWDLDSVRVKKEEKIPVPKVNEKSKEQIMFDDVILPVITVRTIEIPPTEIFLHSDFTKKIIMNLR